MLPNLNTFVTKDNVTKGLNKDLLHMCDDPHLTLITEIHE